MAAASRSIAFPRNSLLELSTTGFTLLCLAGALCLMTPHALGQAAAATGANAKAPAATAVTSPADAARQMAHHSGGGMHEGITVHGHWVIEVRNPDGKLTQRREFENNLTGPGTAVLTGALSGFYVSGGWYITLTDPANPATGSPCKAPNSGPSTAGSCFIFQSGPVYYTPGAGLFCTIPDSQCSNNLTLSSTNVQSNLILSGSIQATQVGNVGAVGTNIAFCASTTSSTALLGFSPEQWGSATTLNADYIDNSFTAATLPAPASGQCGGSNQPSCALTNVQPGQTISVTVTISFS